MSATWVRAHALGQPLTLTVIGASRSGKRRSSSVDQVAGAVLGVDDRELAELDAGAGHRVAAPVRRPRRRGRSRRAGRAAGSTTVGVDADQHDLLVRREAGAGDAVLLEQVGERHQQGAGHPAGGRRDADVQLAVLLLVDADVVAVTDRRRRASRSATSAPAEVLVLEHLAELLHAPVGDQELQPGPRAQPAVAVVAEDRGHALPGVGDLVERDPDAELLGEHRVGRQPATDPEVEAGAELGVDGADERDVVDLGRHVVARVAGQRGLELARQVGVRPGCRCTRRLISSSAGVPSMISSLATPATGEPRNGRGESPQASSVVEARRRSSRSQIGRDVLDPDPVELDVLAVGDVGGVAGELLADGRRARARRRGRAAAPSERTRIMKNSSSSSSSSSIAVLPPSKPGARWV